MAWKRRGQGRFLWIGALCFAQPAWAESTAYGYDVFGRLITTGHHEGPVDGLRTEYDLDAADNRSQIFAGDARLTITAGQSMFSADSRFRLTMQADGNLVLYMGGVVLWSSNTYGTGADRAIMQSNGHFVLYRPDYSSPWDSGTGGSVGASLYLQNDGNLVIYDVNRRPIWNTQTGGH